MRLVLILVTGVLAAWLAFVAFLAVARPKTTTLRTTKRLLPDTARLVARLARDHTIPLRTRLPVWLLVGYLAVPFDLVPDFIPVLGYADDVILVAVVLRRLGRKAGRAKLEEHWPGDPEGLAALDRLLRLS